MKNTIKGNEEKNSRRSQFAVSKDSSLKADPSSPCEWCAKGDTPKLLDEDGTLCWLTGKEGMLSHAHEEYWWPCLRFRHHIYFLPRLDKWQSIETAPVNQSVLAYIPNAEHYGEGIYRAIQIESDWTIVDGKHPRHWQATGWHVGRDLPDYATPTHWMPLPDPPEPDASELKG